VTDKETADVALLANTAPPEVVKAKVEQRVGEYIACRDKIKELNEAHEASIKPLVELQNMLTGWLQSFLEQAGADSIKTQQGTCYSTTRYSASLADPESFMTFVKSTENFDLIDRKANATAVRAYVEEHGQLPPGVNLNAIKTVGVRRASGK
jgi:hypothetical protein